MKMWKNGCFLLIITSIFLFISTWIPNLYEPDFHNVQERYDQLQIGYQESAQALGINQDAFSKLVTRQDIEKQTDALEIQKRATELMKEVKKQGNREIDDAATEQIAIHLQELYELAILGADTSELLTVIRYSTLGFAIVIELLFLLISRKKKA